jgi:hypothetical protein
VDWENRNAIVRKLLRILPADRKVLVRTREMKRRYLGPALTTEADVSARRRSERVGYHDDCFLGAFGDQGTWHNPAEQTDLLIETNRVPIGGESGGEIEGMRGACPNPAAELSALRFSFLDRDFGPIADSWEPGGCLDDMDRGLGYRFALRSFSSSTSVARAAKLPFTLKVRNRGWASTMNHRRVLLVLRHSETKEVHRFRVWSTRFWTPGAHTLHHPGIRIPAAMPTGEYRLLLSLPDPATVPAVEGGVPLSGRAAYAIRLANAGDLWQAQTGFNPVAAQRPRPLTGSDHEVTACVHLHGHVASPRADA